MPNLAFPNIAKAYTKLSQKVTYPAILIITYKLWVNTKTNTKKPSHKEKALKVPATSTQLVNIYKAFLLLGDIRGDKRWQTKVKQRIKKTIQRGQKSYIWDIKTNHLIYDSNP